MRCMRDWVWGRYKRVVLDGEDILEEEEYQDKSVKNYIEDIFEYHLCKNYTLLVTHLQNHLHLQPHI